jgi:hypothetical protein
MFDILAIIFLILLKYFFGSFKRYSEVLYKIMIILLWKAYTPFGYGLDDGGVGVQVPVGSRILLHVVQKGSGAHPASYPVGTGSSFPKGKAAMVCS